METDRELLLLAARAAGLNYDERSFAEPGRFKAGWGMVAGFFEPCCEDASDGPHFWNPLTDDGDALRLAVKLGLRVLTESLDAKPAVVSKDGRIHILGYKSSDACAQVRRCIVRAAASIAQPADVEGR